MALSPTQHVWRYMSFAKFVWMLQKKQLWLSCSELFDDKWEVMPDSSQVNAIINNRPTSLSPKDALESTGEIIKALRKQVFINCWTASEHESHALWRIYCPASEGVAIQTSLDRLRKSVALPVLEVRYDTNNINNTSLDVTMLVTQKRPMFAYEQEVRVVFVKDLSDPTHPDRRTVGVGLEWDPELHIENIYVHPDSQFWFIETVTETVRQFAPMLSNQGSPRVWYSKMSMLPPF